MSRELHRQVLWCLNPFDYMQTREVSDKCKHNQGYWLVDYQQQLYRFEPSTHLQKDLWLGEMERAELNGEHLLRWYCSLCDNIQMP